MKPEIGFATASVIAAIRTAAEAAYPHECCGLVVTDQGGRSQLIPVEQSTPSIDSFVIEPSVIVATRRRGENIRAIYHSHPDAPACPSDKDIESMSMTDEPLWPGVAWIIASVESGRCVDITSHVWNSVHKCFEPKGRQ